MQASTPIMSPFLLGVSSRITTEFRNFCTDTMKLATRILHSFTVWIMAEPYEAIGPSSEMSPATSTAPASVVPILYSEFNAERLSRIATDRLQSQDAVSINNRSFWRGQQ